MIQLFRNVRIVPEDNIKMVFDNGIDTYFDNWTDNFFIQNQYEKSLDATNLIIKVTNTNNLFSCDYLRIKINTDDSWLYFFITEIVYLNNNCYRLTCQLDVMNNVLKSITDINTFFTDNICLLERETDTSWIGSQNLLLDKRTITKTELSDSTSILNNNLLKCYLITWKYTYNTTTGIETAAQSQTIRFNDWDLYAQINGSNVLIPPMFYSPLGQQLNINDPQIVKIELLPYNFENEILFTPNGSNGYIISFANNSGFYFHTNGGYQNTLSIRMDQTVFGGTNKRFGDTVKLYEHDTTIVPLSTKNSQLNTSDFRDIYYTFNGNSFSIDIKDFILTTNYSIKVLLYKVLDLSDTLILRLVDNNNPNWELNNRGNNSFNYIYIINTPMTIDLNQDEYYLSWNERQNMRTINRLDSLINISQDLVGSVIKMNPMGAVNAAYAGFDLGIDELKFQVKEQSIKNKDIITKQNGDLESFEFISHNHIWFIENRCSASIINSYDTMFYSKGVYKNRYIHPKTLLSTNNLYYLKAEYDNINITNTINYISYNQLINILKNKFDAGITFLHVINTNESISLLYKNRVNNLN